MIQFCSSNSNKRGKGIDHIFFPRCWLILFAVLLPFVESACAVLLLFCFVLLCRSIISNNSNVSELSKFVKSSTLVVDRFVEERRWYLVWRRLCVRSVCCCWGSDFPDPATNRRLQHLPTVAAVLPAVTVPIVIRRPDRRPSIRPLFRLVPVRLQLSAKENQTQTEIDYVISFKSETIRHVHPPKKKIK